MYLGIATSLCLFFFQQLLIIKIQATAQCYVSNGTTPTFAIYCSDGCCSSLATSSDTACCSNISWSSLAIPFFIVAGVCFCAICFIYCRPIWKMCLCGYKCPCGNRTQVQSASATGSNANSVHVINNDGLPDYETVTKDPPMKDLTPPPYNFVTLHPNDFGIELRVPSAPPRYYSRPNSAAVGDSSVPIES
ncbi:unnamed protein product [Rotaria magnacalcarata]|uniref:Uncharacterized protein n=1 Tax=Rotaria magnacalcarata TaxID=392030 RepID=A0A816ZJE0_9BILA|nr:unnamed protein product [Rotaria magnacalcarata]CAF2215774.1 unnamed protein product [Rotaria magnacalcarata]CAF4247125.1 unnamed protein product [Rotaria magnacalcarata]CAF4306543.1 unnamed protein product [Rotaria magnacalcarata]